MLRRAPSSAALAELARRDGTLAWCDVAQGTHLEVGPDVEDGASVRYGIVNLGGRDRSDIEARADAAVRALGFELEPLASNRRVESGR